MPPKFRKEIETGEVPTNYMRQYYDVYSLLADSGVQAFTGTSDYYQHKEKRFPTDDLAIPVNQNEAFLLNDPVVRERLVKRYEGTKALYYQGQPSFDEILKRIHQFIDRL